MKLQNMIMPSPETCTEEALYYRIHGKREPDFNGNILKLRRNTELYFDTYFNSFSVGKWKKYAKIQNVYVALKFCGKMKITLIHKDKIGIETEILSRKIKEVVLESTGEEHKVYFDDVSTSGLYSIDLQALEATEFQSGYFGTDIDKIQVRPIKIALDICTFRRELFVKRNMDLLAQRVFNSERYQEFSENLEVFIIDNAQTLDIADFKDPHIHLYANRNLGGAGGFTRGLIEIKQKAEELNVTHALLMDDDIIIEPESIFRTWTMLSVLKDEYQNAFIGGAMLRLDIQHIQVESGAVWNQGTLINRKAGLDLRNVEACIYNEVEEGIDYSAWWYTTMPLSVVQEDNLPLPIFIRGDDVEYGLRNAKTIIMMNGICVWHEPFENKYASTMFYYILRNRLIDNAIHEIPLSKENFIQTMYQLVREELYLYRYKNANLLLDGVEDYLKGIEWLKGHNGEELHKQVMEQSYKMQYIENLEIPFDYGRYKSAFQEVNDESFKHKVIRRLTVNGTFLSATRDNVIVPVVGCREINVYRAKQVLNYDAVAQKGFVTVQNKEEAQACMRRMKRVKGMIADRYDSVNEEYKQRHRELMNREFWNTYLAVIDDKSN